MTVEGRNRKASRAADREAAFTFWHDEGRYRTAAVVAERFGVTRRTVEKWSADEDWNARAARIEVEARRQADRQLVESAARRLKLQHAAVEQALVRYIRGVQAGTTQLTPMDALAWAKHGHLLDGGATERVAAMSAPVDEWRQRIIAAVADEVSSLGDEQVSAELLVLDGAGPPPGRRAGSAWSGGTPTDHERRAAARSPRRRPSRSAG